MSRAMMPAQRAAVAGLVSVPTTGKTYKSRTEGRAVELRDELAAFAPDKHRSRVARLRRGVGVAARAHLASRDGFRADAVFMVTATYRPGVEPAANHVKEWLRRMRLWARARGYEFRYVWVAELQQRGVLHYHVAVWLPRDCYIPRSDAQGWWPHGSTRTERARAAVPYLLKYFSKALDAAALPKGVRMYGVGGLDHVMRRTARWLRLPGFVRARSDVFDDWSAARGGGWADPEGFVIPSEFERAWLGDRYGLIRVADHGRPFQADGPFTWLHRSPGRS